MIVTSYQKEVLKSAVPSLLLVAAYFVVINLLPTSNVYTNALALLSLVYGYSLFRSIRDHKKPFIKDYIITLVVVVCLYTAGYFLGAYGIIGTVLMVLGVVVYKLLRKRSEFMKGIREVETMMFGSTLDKNNWQDNKPKLPKVKIR